MLYHFTLPPTEHKNFDFFISLPIPIISLFLKIVVGVKKSGGAVRASKLACLGQRVQSPEHKRLRGFKVPRAYPGNQEGIDRGTENRLK